MIRENEEMLENDPEQARKVDTAIEELKKEYPDFFDKMKDKTLADITPSELKELFDMVGNHVYNTKKKD